MPAARAYQPLAQNVFFGDERGIGGLKSLRDAEHRERDLMARQGERLRPRRDRHESGKPVLEKHMRHALARAFAPQRDQRPLARGLQRVDVFGHRLEDIGAGCCALGGEGVAGMRADVDDVRGLLRRGERRQPRQRGMLQPSRHSPSAR